MEDFSLIPFDEGTDVLVQTPRPKEPVRPPSLPMSSEPVLSEPLPDPEAIEVFEPRSFINEWLNRLLAPFVVLLTAVVVYRLFF